MPKRASEKTGRNVPLTLLNAEKAQRLGWNVSAIGDSALVQAVRDAEAREWAEENSEALAERDRWIEDNGAPLADIQVLRVD